MLAYTLKNIQDDVEEFANNHQQVYSYSFGSPKIIGTKSQEYPLIHLSPTTSKNEGSRMYMGFDIYILDLEKQDYSNLVDILTETMNIGVDLVSFFQSQNDEYYYLNNDYVTFTPISAFDPVLSGYILSVEFEIDQNNNNCNIPIA
jgi:hypothetical protein